MADYIPYPMYPLDTPIDISFVFKDEKPAGKHGFLKAVGDHFEFEDGTKVAFWGTNFNGGANFPEFEYSEKLAKRLAKIGLNMVRFHQLDAEWDTPNIFQFTKGERKGNTLTFDPESINRLDYLIYCLKNEGIYVYFDMLTYRKFKTGDGVENPLALPDAAKPYCMYNRRLIELQKQFCYDVWNHINPYTGLAYKDDPAIVMTEIVNECDLFSKPITAEPYATEFRTLFKKWLAKHKISYDADNCDLGNTDEPMVKFKMHVHEEYFKEMREFMKKLGVKIPIAGTNWTKNLALLKSNLGNDFTDSHVYYYDWNWKEFSTSCMNRSMSEIPESGFAVLSCMRVFDKPYFVSEWDVPWPNAYRAESSILYPAVGALQGWGGFTIHTYAYGATQENMKVLGKEISANSIGGVPYRQGIFSTWNDPSKFGLFYHSSLITRRGDIAPANKKLAVKIEDLTVRADHRIAFANNINALSAAENSPLETNVKPAFNIVSEKSQVGAYFGGRTKANEIVDEKKPLIHVKEGEVASDNGQMYRSWDKKYGYIDTDMTKCAYGFLGENDPVELDGVSIDCKTDFAVIAMSSLSKDKITSSDNILLTTVGRSQNTDAVFDGEKMLDLGKPPIIVEVIEADIAIKTDVKTLRVWAVNAEGFLIGAVPSTYEDGVFKFTLGKTFRSMHYLIQAE